MASIGYRARLLGRIMMVSVLAAGSLTGPGNPATPAHAATAADPIVQMPDTGVSAQALPTVQVDGVVWSQAVVGTTVYAGGSFANARPAGAAPGTQLTPRGNLLAYDITTGALITSFAPNLNGQVLSVTSSPDGSRIYVTGDFTAANGHSRSRLAAFDTDTGALVASFAPAGPNAQGKAVVATDSTVYVGGSFTQADGQTRNHLAAYRASDGALLPWNPDADGTVWALALAPDESALFAGGALTTVGGQPDYGLAKLHPTTGAVLPWNANQLPDGIRNGGSKTGITSLTASGDYVYGTTYMYGPGGNHEGVFKASVDDGDLAWVTTCHGDHYSSFPNGGVVYTVGHAHYCGNHVGGLPQFAEWDMQHTMAWVDDSALELLHEPFDYPKLQGHHQAPALVAWNPDLAMGSATGQFQAGWNITGNADYVVVGGEFPSVNGVGQQGLVRFARRAVTGSTEGPRFLGNRLAPTLVPTGPTSVRVSWLAGFDRDDLELTYRVYRNWKLIDTRTAASTWWNIPSLGFVDSGLSPGVTYSYTIYAVDPDGNAVWGSTTPVTTPTEPLPSNPYADLVRSLGARVYWPLSEAGGVPMKRVVTDRAGHTDGEADNGVTFDQAGAIVGGDTAAYLMDNDWSRVFAFGTETAPNEVTVQIWVKTTTTEGGRLLGFSDVPYLNGGHRDRVLYLDDAGHVIFGVRAANSNGAVRTVVSPTAVNDGNWHLLTATLGPAGMALYVDDTLVDSRADTVAGEPYLGYWRLGGESLDGWPVVPTSVNMVGTVDEAAIYPTALSQAQVADLWQASGHGMVGNQPPTADISVTCTGLDCTFDGSGSTDPDGTITAYAWQLGDHTSADTETLSHSYAGAGTYEVQLTVTDDRGGTDTATQQLTITALAPGAVIAADTFARTVTDGLGTADTGGSWTTSGQSSDFAVDGGTARISLRAGSGRSAVLDAVSAADVDARMTMAFDKPGSGGGIYTSFAVRRSGTSDYRVKVRSTATTTTVYLVRNLNGAESTLAWQSVPGLVYSPGQTVHLRLQAEGSGSTQLRASVWLDGTTEPADWTVSATDSTPALQHPGTVGIVGYLSGSASHTPVTALLDDLDVRLL